MTLSAWKCRNIARVAVFISSTGRLSNKLANNKAQTKVLQPAKNSGKAAQDKKSQVAVTKTKKAQAQSGQPKKRRFAFFTDIVNELKKVVWPTRQELTRLSLIVLGMCLVMGLLLGLIDYGFSELVAKVLLGGK